MKIKIINPNTTQSMTDSVENLARRVARSDTRVWAVSPASGPDSIECYVDEHLAVPGVLKEVIRGDREEGADAFIIACFGDPGLQAAREVTSKPVLGICESAITAAKFIAPYFSIVSVLDRSRKVTEDVVANYGSGEILPLHPLYRTERVGIWSGPAEGAGGSGTPGRTGGAAGRSGVHPAGMRWFCGLCPGLVCSVGRSCTGRSYARGQICGSYGGHGAAHQQGIYLGISGA